MRQAEKKADEQRRRRERKRKKGELGAEVRRSQLAPHPTPPPTHTHQQYLQGQVSLQRTVRFPLDASRYDVHKESSAVEQFSFELESRLAGDQKVHLENCPGCERA